MPDDQITSDDETDLPIVERSKRVSLHGGDALTADQTRQITQASLARVLLIAGGPESGKSSLITCIYHLFQNGTYCDYLFAGSDTFPGYELRCLLDRVASGLAEPDTERTQNVEKQIDFLHLAVRAKGNERPIQHILFSDLSGEKFQQARTLASGADQLEMFHRADHFIFLVDGASLTDPGQRFREASQTQTLLRSLIERGILSSKSLVMVLFTKWDLVLTDPDKDAVIAFRKQLEEQIRQKFSSSFGDISFFEIAAQPKKGDMKIGYGLDELFPQWVEVSPFTASASIIPWERSSSSREFNRYEIRTP